ncbi:MAG: hypothetical protein ACFB21_08620, partial [Opitutales bacterium]
SRYVTCFPQDLGRLIGRLTLFVFLPLAAFAAPGQHAEVMVPLSVQHDLKGMPAAVVEKHYVIREITRHGSGVQTPPAGSQGEIGGISN